MRASLASSIAVTCAAVLALPVSSAAPAAAEVLVQPPAASALPPAPDLPGSTQSLPLGPLGPSSRAGGSGEQGLPRRDVKPFSLVGVVWDDPRAPLHGTVQVRTRATGTDTWSEWQDVETHNDEHGADPDSAEGTSRALRGSTAPLWVGDSDGVEIRVRAEAGGTGGAPPLPAGLRLELVDPGEGPETQTDTEPVLETEPGTDTGTEVEQVAEAAPPQTRTAPAPAAPAGATAAVAPADATSAAVAPEAPLPPAPTPAPAATVPAATLAAPSASGALTAPPLSGLLAGLGAINAQLTPYAAPWLPALSKEATEAIASYLPPFLPRTPASGAEAQEPAKTPVQAAAAPYIGPRPAIVTRKGWGADESIREKTFVYTNTIKAAFVHHSATGNNYTCAQAPSVLRSIYRYHVLSSGWRDFGYNFAIDKCGNIYEGRAGGVDKPVLGAHTLGFNTSTMGIAVLGTFSTTAPPAASVTAVARLTAWKLGLHGINPKGSVTLTSGGGNLYAKGTKVKFNAIAGHRDGFATDCPGSLLYGKLGTARTSAASYQGR
ncbi:N-acetylmuramoyl-L-alanine amidase [Streptomyces sp. WAC00288]|uniref:peptidoglycan recognition protein family protein n=1 Tax=unclassified Streptomyces TaxID=2593676 RepID=UPI0007894752|nr:MULTISPECIES: peptidoglycan recognition protein [unclassified Streptomyces]AVH97197.1 N-acetylmuramoyl-L-alanine amidase [Streptomyces sp. WAC00288]KYG55802.1 N-acetylmuramoyl-L-alanine amidase [Streptomyces sp. WAC04657]